MDKLNRSKRASQFQKDYLVNYLESNKDMANDKFITPDGARLRDSKWKSLGVILNNLGGPQKTGDKWKKYWRDLRLNTKAKYSALRDSAEFYGPNNSRRTKALTLLEEKIIHITTDTADDGDNTPEVGFGEDTFLIYEDCGAESTEYLFEEIKCESPEIETSTTEVIETKIFENTTTAEITDDDGVPYTSEDLAETTAIKNYEPKPKKARRETQENENHVEKLLKIEEKKLEAMELANDLKREQLKLIKQQTEAIRADTEMKRYFGARLEEAVVAFKAKS